ncbi:MAG: c-type cytochrome [Deltaproteobacteria bacterium]|nr:c-type cytochrome [Deltaproteobacteria bacterium]
MKKTILVASLVTLAFLVIAIVQENLYPEWRKYQTEYARILDDKARDDLGKMIRDGFNIELKQVVVPQLKVVDRCVSCHSGMDDPRMMDEPNPHKTHPGDILEIHPYGKYGCTICHQGQGRATTFDEAKASDIHWDYPLLPKRLAQSGCAMCHAPDSLEESAPLAARGYELFVSKGCYSCHKIGNLGGNTGPALDSEGAKKKAAFPFAYISGEHTIDNWHIEHLMDPQKVVAGSRMKNFNLEHGEALALTTYILSLKGIELPVNMLPKDRIEWEYNKQFRKALPGEELYRRFCFACHGEGMASHFDPVLNRYVPTIRNPAFLSIATDEFLKKNIMKGRPGRDMPAWEEKTGGLKEEEIDNIVAFLRGDVKISESYIADYKSEGDKGKGAYLFERYCSGCHGNKGEGIQAPALANPVFQESATDGYIKATIELGRHGTAMKGFSGDSLSFSSLTEKEIGEGVVFIRSL